MAREQARVAQRYGRAGDDEDQQILDNAMADILTYTLDRYSDGVVGIVRREADPVLRGGALELLQRLSVEELTRRQVGVEGALPPIMPVLRLGSRFDDLPIDVIFELLDHLPGTLTHLRLAIAYPAIFQQVDLNLIRNDAELQRHSMQEVPGLDDDHEPMLSVAIREGFSWEVIQTVLNTYDELLGRNSIDAFYMNRRHVPPLLLALRSSRFDVARLLLERGADFEIAYPIYHNMACNVGFFAHSCRTCNLGTLLCRTAVLDMFYRAAHQGWRLRVPEHPPEEHNEFREFCIQLCLAHFERSAEHMRRIILQLFGGNDEDWSQILGVVFRRVMSRNQIDATRQTFIRELPEIVQAIATDGNSAMQRGDQAFSEDAAISSSQRALLQLASLARSDEYIAQLIEIQGANVRPQQIVAIAREGREYHRSATVVLRSVSFSRDYEDFLLHLIDDVFDNATGDTVAFVEDWLIPLLYGTGNLEILRRLLYVCVRDGQRNAALRILNSYHDIYPSTQVWFLALSNLNTTISFPELMAYFTNETRQPPSVRYEIRPVYGHMNVSALPDRDWADRYADFGWNVLEWAIIMNDYEAALAIARVLPDSLDPMAVDQDLLQALRFKRIALDLNGHPDWTAPLGIVAEHGMLTDDLTNTLRRGDEQAFIQLTDLFDAEQMMLP
ncbi:hypothetical protein F4818DRAFT_300720 [Hypoxylon cercidicola]|nr:hypothetical protein F4818DRAFT_300720 [Hypoxylon cercidicola]